MSRRRQRERPWILRRWRIVRCWWLAAPLVVTGPGTALTTPSPGTFEEYDVKAALVFKLAKFIEWPQEAFRQDPEHYTFCVVGRGPMGPALERAVAGKSIGGRRVHVERGLKVEELEVCQVVFTSSSDGKEHSRIAEAAADRPLLLVGEAPCFTTRGGMINFFVDNARVRFEINPERAERAGLRIDPNVLRLARIVGPGGECDHVAPRE